MKSYAKSIKIFLCVVCSIFLSNSAFSENFIPIKSYVTKSKKELSYGIQQEYFTIPSFGGVISDFPIKIDTGTKIEISIKSNSKLKTGEYMETLLIGLYSQKQKLETATIDNPNDRTDYIIFKINPNTFKKRINNGYSGSDNNIKANLKSIYENKGTYYVPLQWNKFSIIVSDKNTIKLLLNDEECLIYKGNFPKMAYLGIGDYTALSIDIGKEIIVNNKPISLNLKID